MEAGATEVKVREIVAAVTKDNNEVAIIMAIMIAAEVIAISIMVEVVDRIMVEGDLEAATTEAEQQTSKTSEEVGVVEVDEVMVGTTRLDTSITAAVETITTPKIRNSIETIRTHWTSFMSCELRKTTILCSSSAPTKTTVILAFTRAPSTTFSKRPVS